MYIYIYISARDLMSLCRSCWPQSCFGRFKGSQSKSKALFMILCKVLSVATKSTLHRRKPCRRPSPQPDVCLQKILLSVEATQNVGDRRDVIGQLTSHSRSPSATAVNCNTILNTATRNCERLMTPSKRLHGHGVGYTEYYNGTLRVIYINPN